MPTNSLRSAIDVLANKFAAGVLDAIRTASLAELLSEAGGATGRRASTKAAPAVARASSPAAPKRATRAGRLARRTPADIAKTLATIVALVKTKKAGLRSEQIRAALKLDKREMPRVLADGLKSKKLRSRGKKRATTYFAG